MLTKNELGYILGDFLQTHLVTLISGDHCNRTRVTRFGECSPMGLLFTLGSYLKTHTYRESLKFWDYFSTVHTYKVCINVDKKMIWATFWAIF
jgi:hypothetical protein